MQKSVLQPFDIIKLTANIHAYVHYLFEDQTSGEGEICIPAGSTIIVGIPSYKTPTPYLFLFNILDREVEQKLQAMFPNPLSKNGAYVCAKSFSTYEKTIKKKFTMVKKFDLNDLDLNNDFDVNYVCYLLEHEMFNKLPPILSTKLFWMQAKYQELKKMYDEGFITIPELVAWLSRDIKDYAKLHLQ
jgi:hypothetical protein